MFTNAYLMILGMCAKTVKSIIVLDAYHMHTEIVKDAVKKKSTKSVLPVKNSHLLLGDCINTTLVGKGLAFQIKHQL